MHFERKMRVKPRNMVSTQGVRVIANHSVIETSGQPLTKQRENGEGNKKQQKTRETRGQIMIVGKI